MTEKAVDLDRRFGGIIRLYGKKKFQLIQNYHVCVIGIGGVGSWVAESLARHGVGKITLIDMDHIAESNINRQIHALDSTIGESKIQAMKNRIIDINPMCQVKCIDDFLEESNIERYISSQFNYVVDAIDQSSVKINLAEHCQANNLALLMIGGAGGRTDPSRIKILDLSKTYGDPLLTNIRKYFNKKNKGLRSVYEIPTIFSDEPIIKSDSCGTDESERGLNCDGYGSSQNITASMAFFAVAYVFSKISI